MSVRQEHEITIAVEGEKIPVTLTEPGPLTKYRVASVAPTELAEKPPHEVSSGDIFGPEIVEFMEQIVSSTSDFPVELLDELPESAFIDLVGDCSRVFSGEEPRKEGEELGDSEELYWIQRDLGVDPGEYR